MRIVVDLDRRTERTPERGSLSRGKKKLVGNGRDRPATGFGAELPMQLQANYAGSCPKATVRDT
jgi:hypothetical protein